MTKPILFLHISKTAGSALKRAIFDAFSDKACSELIFEDEVRRELARGLSSHVYAAHVGFDTAKKMNADVVTVMRDPVSRINSLFNFWHNRVPKVDPAGVFEAVRGMSPQQFFQSNEGRILVGRENCQAYQLASSHNQYGRDRLAKFSDEDILDLALSNLGSCKVVGFVERMEDFERKFSSVFGRPIKVAKENVSKKSHANFIFSKDLRPLVYDSIYLDLELYSRAMREFL
ncbi:sulfotransferase family 2 domain-containing protein [Microbulbifer elongatus]|uniref:sulfotransferase family 2 domain-containing protein n=1 Tax=Microbulbifer elongatus TaxID=86173 RepID=UPI001CFCECF7|nr:sulfotransferase family 2 domain-containing protein [Microbulbifer elongatus]